MSTLEFFNEASGQSSLHTRVSVQNPLPVSGIGYPSGATPLSASSGNQANANAVATLAGAPGQTTYITGFQITGGGATASALVSPTVAGLLGGTATYTYGVVAGATAANPTLQVTFSPAIPASALNTAIVVTAPAFGAGSTNATVTAQGYRL